MEGEIIRSRMIATRTEVVAERGVVAGGHQLEAEAGVRMLRRGGNAVDALVAAACVGFVVEPASCGLGGYGRLSVYLGLRLIADVSLRLRIDSAAAGPGQERSHGRVYGKVFPSYSHVELGLLPKYITIFFRLASYVMTSPAGAVPRLVQSIPSHS